MHRKYWLTAALVTLTAATNAEAQVSASKPLPPEPPRGLSTTMRNDRDRDRTRDRDWDRDRDWERNRDERERLRAWCADAYRDYARQRTDLQQRLRRLHADWHRAHDYDRDYVRQHNALHDRLERMEDQWERSHSQRLRACERRTADYDYDRDYDRDHRNHDRERDRRRF